VIVTLQPAYAVAGKNDCIEGSAKMSKVDNSRDPGKDAMEMITEDAPIDEPAPMISDNLLLLIKEQEVAATDGPEPMTLTKAKQDESMAKFEPDTVIWLPT
jgi:hypothetical protein